MKNSALFICMILSFCLQGQVVINEIYPGSNEVELKNIGTTNESMRGAFILTAMFGRFDINSNLNFSCGDVFMSPGEITVFPVSFNISESDGELLLHSITAIAIDYVQWGSVQPLVTTAFSMGLWDDPAAFIPAVEIGSSIELIDESKRRNPEGFLEQVSPTLCDENTACRIDDVQILDLECMDNGTSDNPTDDYFRFRISVDGVNVSNRVDVAFSNGTVTPSDVSTNCIDCFLESSEGTADGQTNELIVTSQTGDCSFSKKFTAPESCSPDCTLDFFQILNVACVNNGTLNDPSDDYIEFTLNPFGFNVSDSYEIEYSFGGTDGPFPYGQTSTVNTQGRHVAGDGDFSIFIRDSEDPTCLVERFILDLGTCAENCVLLVDSLNIRCDNNTTRFDSLDDFYVLDLQVSSTISGSDFYQATLTPFTLGPVLLKYDTLYTFETDPGSALILANFAFSIIDPDYPDCIGITLHGDFSGPCPSPCELDEPLIDSDISDVCIHPESDPIFTVDFISDVPDEYRLLVLDAESIIQLVTDKNSFDANELDDGMYSVVIVAFEEIENAEVGNGIGRLMGCFELSNPLDLTINRLMAGDLVQLGDTVLCAPENMFDLEYTVDAVSTGANVKSAFVITDLGGKIDFISEDDPLQFSDEIDNGYVRNIYHLAFQGNLIDAETIQDDLATECYHLNSNYQQLSVVLESDCITVSNDNYLPNELKFYPNPTRGAMYLVSNDIVEKWVVYTAGGEIVQEKNKGSIISLINLSPGIYFVSVQFSEGKKAIGRVIKI